MSDTPRERDDTLHAAQEIVGEIERIKAMDGMIDVEHVVWADGRCRISVNGQGHFPCAEHPRVGFADLAPEPSLKRRADCTCACHWPNTVAKHVTACCDGYEGELVEDSPEG